MFSEFTQGFADETQLVTAPKGPAFCHCYYTLSESLREAVRKRVYEYCIFRHQLVQREQRVNEERSGSSLNWISQGHRPSSRWGRSCSQSLIRMTARGELLIDPVRHQSWAWAAPDKRGEACGHPPNGTIWCSWRAVPWRWPGAWLWREDQTLLYYIADHTNYFYRDRLSF